MKTIIKLFIGILLSCNIIAHAQIGDGSIPYSLTDAYKSLYINEQKNINRIRVGEMDNNDLLVKDSLFHLENDFSYTFAAPIEINREIQSDMTWDTIENGFIMGRVQLQSPTSYASFLIFDDFFLPDSTKLYAYNSDGTQYIGAFTESNNKPYGRFSLGPIIGENITLEIIKPIYLNSQPHIHIESFIHSYKDFFNASTNRYSDCTIDVKCPEGDKWCNQIRSVALIIKLKSTGPSAICSGSLITNDRGDFRPYFLTAYHCCREQNVNDWIFIFNYEANECDGYSWLYWSSNPFTGYTFSNSISGATMVAKRGESDFALLELSARPPSHYNVYYAGWDRKNERPEDGAIISHPLGGVKTIALGKDKAKRKTVHFDEYPDFKVKSWNVKLDAGTTKKGSSGAPFFNSEGRIVGQHFGVNSSGKECSNSFRAYEGRLDKSWEDGSSTSSRLRDWLNPNNNTVNVIAMDGSDPCRSFYTFSNANDLHTSINGSWGTRTYNGIYTASDTITAGNNVTIQSGTSVEFYAKAIVLNPGFTASSGSNFIASPKPCQIVCNTNFGKNTEDDNVIILDTLTFNKETINTEEYIIENSNIIEYNQNYNTYTNPILGTFTNEEIIIETIDIEEYGQNFNIFPNPNPGIFTIETNFPLSAIGNLKITNLMGATVYETQNVASNTIQLQNPTAGTFFVVMVLKDGVVITRKMVVQ